MRLTLLSILTIGLLFSCSSNDREKNSNASSPVDIKTLDTTISIAGYWLSENYFNSINEFKSPKKAQDGSHYINIPDRTLKQTIMIDNFHEGGPFLTILKNQDKYEIWEVQNDSITEQENIIETITPSKIKIGDENFVKINPDTAQSGEMILEEILFKGQYLTTDGRRVEFKKNGQLSGLDNFNYYSPIIDYYDTGLQVDQVGLGKSEKDLDWFGFKFNKDTLELYKLKCLTYDSTDNRCVEVDYGELTYKLWRKG